MAMPVKPVRIDITIRAGADFGLNLAWRDKETSNGIDTAGASIDSSGAGWGLTVLQSL